MLRGVGHVGGFRGFDSGIAVEGAGSHPAELQSGSRHLLVTLISFSRIPESPTLTPVE